MRLKTAAGGRRRAAAALLAVACALPMGLPAASREAGLPLPPGLLPGSPMPETIGLLDELRVLRLRAVRPLGQGGSNLNWYDLSEGCDREPFGIIANYHEPGIRERVIEQLIELRARGQQRLSLGLYHLRGSSDAVGRISGTILDSTGGALHPRMMKNVTLYLSDIRDAGFAEILFRYHPQGANDVIRSGSISDALRDENWAIIESVEPLLQASGLVYRTDLMAEGMPRARLVLGRPLPNEPNNSSWSRYAREIWRRYYLLFGADRTVGFSFVSDIDDERIDARAEHLEYVYRVDGALRLPQAFAFSLYGTAERDERWIFERHHVHLAAEGVADLPWIVAETYYNDARAARAIAEAMNATGKSVDFLTQWPLHRETTCDEVSVTPPALFQQFHRFGF